MSSTSGHDKAVRAVTAEAGALRASPAGRFNLDREGAAKRAGKFQALQQQFQKLDQHFEAAVAEIRASLDRASTR